MVDNFYMKWKKKTPRQAKVTERRKLKVLRKGAKNRGIKRRGVDPVEKTPEQRNEEALQRTIEKLGIENFDMKKYVAAGEMWATMRREVHLERSITERIKILRELEKQEMLSLEDAELLEQSVIALNKEMEELKKIKEEEERKNGRHPAG